MQYTDENIETLFVASGARDPGRGKKYLYTPAHPLAPGFLLTESIVYFQEKKGDVGPRRIGWVVRDLRQSWAVVVDLPQPKPDVVSQLKDLHQRMMPGAKPSPGMLNAHRQLYTAINVIVLNVDPEKDMALFQNIQDVLQGAYHGQLHFQCIPLPNPTLPRFYEAVITVMNTKASDLTAMACEVMARMANPLHTDAFFESHHEATLSGRPASAVMIPQVETIAEWAHRATWAPLFRQAFSMLPQTSSVMRYRLELIGMMLGVMMSCYLGVTMLMRNLGLLMMMHGVSVMQRRSARLAQVPAHVAAQCFMLCYNLYELRTEGSPRLSMAMLLSGSLSGLIAVAQLDSNMAASPDGQAKQMRVSVGAFMLGQLVVAVVVTAGQYMWAAPMVLRREQLTQALQAMVHAGDIERLEITFDYPDVDWWSQTDPFDLACYHVRGDRDAHGFFAKYRCEMKATSLACGQTAVRYGIEG